MWRYVLAAVVTAVILICIKLVSIGGLIGHMDLGRLSGMDLSQMGELTAADSGFRWEGAVPSGTWTTVRDVAGTITVRLSEDSLVHVSAIKRWNPEQTSGADTRILTMPSDSGVVVCVAIASTSQCTNNSDERHHISLRRFRGKQTPALVDFTVRIPAGVKVDAGTVLGNVAMEGTRAAVRARTVNGRVELTSFGGPVDAATVNGSITARLDSAAAANPVKLETINGAVTAYLPESFSGDVQLFSVNGALGTDYTLNGASNSQNRRELRGTVGSGGPTVSLRAVNGGVHLRKMVPGSELDSASSAAGGN